MNGEGGMKGNQSNRDTTLLNSIMNIFTRKLNLIITNLSEIAEGFNKCRFIIDAVFYCAFQLNNRKQLKPIELYIMSTASAYDSLKTYKTTLVVLNHAISHISLKIERQSSVWDSLCEEKPKKSSALEIEFAS